MSASVQKHRIMFMRDACLVFFFKLLISVVVGLSTDLISWFSCTVFFGVFYGEWIGTALFLLLFHSHGGSLCSSRQWCEMKSFIRDSLHVSLWNSNVWI